MSVRQRAPVAARSQRGPSRLDAVLRAGQAHRAAAMRTGGNPNLLPPMNITELPAEMVQLVTTKLIAANAGDATSLCSDLQAWCRAHPVACQDPDMWRVAFLALLNWQPTIQVQRVDPNPPPNPWAASEAARDARDAARAARHRIFGPDSDSDSDSSDGPSLPSLPQLLPKIWVTVPNPEPEPTPAPYETYKDAFTDTCTRIDQVRNGNPGAIQHVHPALRGSKVFMQSFAVVDALVLDYARGFDRHTKDAMFQAALVANPRNARHVVSYSQPDYDGSVWGNIEDDMLSAAVWDNPKILDYLYQDRDVDLDLRELMDDRPLTLEHVANYNSDYANDECLVLRLVKRDGRVLEWASKSLRSDKRIVLAALKEAGSVAFQWVLGTALRRDPDVLTAAGKTPWPGQPRVRRNREEEEPCADDDDASEEKEEEEEEEEYDPNQSPAGEGEDAPMLPTDYMSAAEGERSPGSPGSPGSVERAPNLRRIERQLAEEEATSSEEEPESPTATFDVKLKARNKGDSSSEEEEDITHGLDDGDVMADGGEDWEEGASPPKTPPRGDYPRWRR